ncbi:hypothetical protein [Paenibacillus amylolyticus]|uniref:hypothetical protein n=1 Tax=Paenibacillus amylolyticus TaxID=1451 RepID=UPI000FD85934|nr:hypothetical protein [Paenibacillus amylolyticus]
MADPLITTVCRFKLFKQPYKIGDTYESGGETRLVLGIEGFELNRHSNVLKVRYTCQRLDVLDFVSKAKAYPEPHQIEMEATLRHEKWDKVSDLNLGTTTTYRGERYKILEYTEISLKGTDLYVSFLARQVHPVDRKEAKAKLLNERRKKLKFEII